MINPWFLFICKLLWLLLLHLLMTCLIDMYIEREAKNSSNTHHIFFFFLIFSQVNLNLVVKIWLQDLLKTMFHHRMPAVNLQIQTYQVAKNINVQIQNKDRSRTVLKIVTYFLLKDPVFSSLNSCLLIIFMC